MLNLMNSPIKYPVWILKHCRSSGWRWVLAEMPFTKPVYPFPLPHGPQLPFLCSVVLSGMGALAPGRLPSQRIAATWLTQWYKSAPLPSRLAPLCVALCAPGLLCDQTEARLQPGTHPCSPFLCPILLPCLLEESTPQTNHCNDSGSAPREPSLRHTSALKTSLQQVELAQILWSQNTDRLD